MPPQSLQGRGARLDGARPMAQIQTLTENQEPRVSFHPHLQNSAKEISSQWLKKLVMSRAADTLSHCSLDEGLASPHLWGHRPRQAVRQAGTSPSPRAAATFPASLAGGPASTQTPPLNKLVHTKVRVTDSSCCPLESAGILRQRWANQSRLRLSPKRKSGWRLGWGLEGPPCLGGLGPQTCSSDVLCGLWA